jgi:hypothetical protein
MPYVGTIISHDPSLHTGLLIPDESHEAIPFTEGDVLNWDRYTPLLGERVRFEIVQISGGFVAVHIHLPPRERKPDYSGNLLPALVSPLIVGTVTYLLHIWLWWPLIISYFITVNFVALVLMILIAASGYSPSIRPCEWAAMAFAALGGSPAMIFSAYLLPTRFRTEQALVFFIGLTVCYGLLARRYVPEIFEPEFWKNLL